MNEEKQPSVDHFLDLIRRSRRGRFKIYIGMSAGVGKTYRMLQEAHALLRSGMQVQIGYIETHGRPETAALLEGLPLLPRRKLFYKGKELEELDVPVVLALKEVAAQVERKIESEVVRPQCVARRALPGLYQQQCRYGPPDHSQNGAPGLALQRLLVCPLRPDAG